MKRNYPTAFNVPVNRYELLKSLGFPGQKLPAGFTFRGKLELFAQWGGWPRPSLGEYEVEVVPTNNPGRQRSAGKHRIFVIIGEQRIPFGRLAQTKLLTPGGTKG